MNNIESCLFFNSVHLYPLSFTDYGNMEKDIYIDANVVCWVKIWLRNYKVIYEKFCLQV